MGIVRKNIFLLYHPMFASRFKQGLWPLSRGLNRPITFYTKAPAFSRFPARTYATYRRFDGSNGYGYSYYNWNKLLYNKNTIYIGIGLIGFYIYNLHEAPFTKRLRFIWTPYWLEKMIGDYSYYQLTAEFANQIIPDSNPIYSKISTIMNKLLTAAISGIDDEKQKKYLQSLDWKIHVIQTDADQPPNAFILPNGKIFIFSTILPICQNDDGLATVLSHELSHQIAHHSGEQISKNPIYILLAIALYTITQSSSLNELIIGSLLKLPASREMESEADHIGCELLAKLCFNLNEAVNFWNRMDQFENKMKGTLDTSRIEEFFSTHPATATRIADIKSWLPGLEHMKEQSGCYEYQFGHFRNATKDYFSRA